jgi:hypothetical protein
LILFSLPSIVRWRSSKYLQRCVIWSSLKTSQQGHGYAIWNISCPYVGVLSCFLVFMTSWLIEVYKFYMHMITSLIIIAMIGWYIDHNLGCALGNCNMKIHGTSKEVSFMVSLKW